MPLTVQMMMQNFTMRKKGNEEAESEDCSTRTSPGSENWPADFSGSQNNDTFKISKSDNCASCAPGSGEEGESGPLFVIQADIPRMHVRCA